MAVLHTIKAWLYENLLTAGQNDYAAQVSAERTLTVREICESAAERGGADISAAAMEHAVALFHKDKLWKCKVLRLKEGKERRARSSFTRRQNRKPNTASRGPLTGLFTTTLAARPITAMTRSGGLTSIGRACDAACNAGARNSHLRDRCRLPACGFFTNGGMMEKEFYALETRLRLWEVSAQP